MKIITIEARPSAVEPLLRDSNRVAWCDYSNRYCTGRVSLRVSTVATSWAKSFTDVAAALLPRCPRETWTYVSLSDFAEIVEAYVHNEEAYPINQARMVCLNCRLAFMSHANGKCLWEPTQFKPITIYNVPAYTAEVVNLRTRKRRPFWTS